MGVHENDTRSAHKCCAEDAEPQQPYVEPAVDNTYQEHGDRALACSYRHDVKCLTSNFPFDRFHRLYEPQVGRMTAHTVEHRNSTRHGVAKEENLEAARQLSHIMGPKRRVSQTIEMEMRWSSQPIFRKSRALV